MTRFLLYLMPISFVGLMVTLPCNDTDAWCRRFIEVLAAGAAW